MNVSQELSKNYYIVYREYYNEILSSYFVNCCSFGYWMQCPFKGSYINLLNHRRKTEVVKLELWYGFSFSPKLRLE